MIGLIKISVSFNRMLSAFSATGIIDVWTANSMWWSARVARSGAKTKGTEWELPVEETQTASAFLLELFLIGGIIAMVICIMETTAFGLVIVALFEKFMAKIVH